MMKAFQAQPGNKNVTKKELKVWSVVDFIISCQGSKRGEKRAQLIHYRGDFPTRLCSPRLFSQGRLPSST
jgi:hypothetical protein